MLACCLVAAPAQGGDWRITPRITVQQDYTDNVTLARGDEAKSDFITEINPGVSIRGEGRRASLNLDYTLQQLIYRRDENDDALNHQLQASGRAEVIKQVFFLDARAGASQQNRDNRGRVATSNISVSENRENVYTFAVTPVFRHHLGKYADTEVRMPYDWVENENDAEASTSLATEARITSGRYFARLPWDISYSQRTIDNGNGLDETGFEQLRATLNYVFNRRFSMFFTLGYEDNDTNNQDIEQSGGVRRLGLTWTPSPRTSFSGGYEERPLGDSLFFDLNHRQRRTVWSASLSQSATTSRDLQLQRVLIPLEDPFGEPIVTPQGDIVLVPVDTVRQSTAVLVTQDFRASVALKGRRTTYQGGVNWSERDGVGGDDETVTGLTFAVSRDLSRQLSARINGQWQETEFDLTDDPDTLWSVGLSLSYEIAEAASGRLTLRRVDSDTGDGRDAYRENQVTAGVTISF